MPLGLSPGRLARIIPWAAMFCVVKIFLLIVWGLSYDISVRPMKLAESILLHFTFAIVKHRDYIKNRVRK